MTDRAITRKQAANYEAAVTKALTAVLGEPVDDGSMLEWQMAVHGGFIDLHLVQDSKKPGRAHRARTLFCRFSGLGGRYGLSGKNNMHCPSFWSNTDAISTTIFHVRQMSEQGSAERSAFDALKTLEAAT